MAKYNICGIPITKEHTIKILEGCVRAHEIGLQGCSYWTRRQRILDLQQVQAQLEKVKKEK